MLKDRASRVAMVAVLCAVVSAQGVQMAYTNESEFLTDLEGLGYTWARESFEEDDPWGGVRSTIPGGNMTAPALTNWTVVWTANNGDSQITTSSGAALTGSWGFYSLPHGNYSTGTDCHLPGHCGDGFKGYCNGPFYAAGGWVRGTYGGKLEVYLDGDTNNPIDFPEACDAEGENCISPNGLTTASEFFGVIDTAGFSVFEFREMEGTAEDQKFMWADDFVFGFDVPPPPVISSIALSGDNLNVGMSKLANQGSYTLQQSTNLLSTNWSATMTILALGPYSNVVQMVTNGPVVYYRLRGE